MQLLREVKEFRATYDKVFNLCKLITGVKKETKKIYQEYGKVVDYKGTALYRFLNHPEKAPKLAGQLGKFGRESNKIMELRYYFSEELFEEVKNSRRLTLLLVFWYSQGNKKYKNLFPEISFFRGIEARELFGTGPIGWYEDLWKREDKGATRIVKLETMIDGLPEFSDMKKDEWDDRVVKFVEKTIKSWWDKSGLEPEPKKLTLQEALDKIAKLEAKIEKLELELKSKQ